jgi:hypothetical protein
MDTDSERFGSLISSMMEAEKNSVIVKEIKVQCPEISTCHR